MVMFGGVARRNRNTKSGYCRTCVGAAYFLKKRKDLEGNRQALMRGISYIANKKSKDN